jgi:hypothetical protein
MGFWWFKSNKFHDNYRDLIYICALFTTLTFKTILMESRILTLFILLISFSSWSQVEIEKFDFKELTNIMHRTKLLAITDDNIFIGYTQKGFAPSMTILQYSKDFKFLNKLSTRIITKPGESQFESFQAIGNNLLLFTKIIDEKSHRVALYSQSIDPKSFTAMTSPIQVLEYQYPDISKFSLDFDLVEGLNNKMLNSFKFFKGKTSLFVTGNIYDFEKKIITTQLSNLSNTNELKWNKKFNFELTSSKNAFVDSDDNFNIVSQEYSKVKDINNIVFTKIKRNGTSTASGPISLKGISLSTPYFGQNKSGNIVFSSLYSPVNMPKDSDFQYPLFSCDNAYKFLSGVLYYEIDFETSEIIVSKMTPLPDEFKKELNTNDLNSKSNTSDEVYSYDESKYLIKESVNLVNIYPTNFTSSVSTEDGLIMIIEQSKLEYDFNTYKKILVVKISNSGDVIWANSIKRHQMDNGFVSSRYNGYEVFVDKGTLHVLFNNSLKNKDSNKSEILYGGKNNSYIEDYKINISNGKSERASLDNTKESILMPLSNLNNDKWMYFVLEGKFSSDFVKIRKGY